MSAQQTTIEVLTRPCPLCGVPCFETLNLCRLEPEPMTPDELGIGMSVMLLPGVMLACSPLPGQSQYRLHEHQPEEA